jgi:hypothetical protein
LAGLAQPKLYGDRFSDRDLDDAVRLALRGLMAARASRRRGRKWRRVIYFAGAPNSK